MVLGESLGLVRIQDTTERNVDIDRERSNIDNKPPGTYTYTRGTRLSGFIKIVNKDAEIARARALVYDEANQEEIWVSEPKDLYANQVIQGDFTVTVDKDRRITMYAQYYDPIRGMWRTGDIYGSWELQFREAPLPTEEPDLEFISFDVPSKAKPGETITVNATVVNNGGAGDCKIVLGYYDTNFKDEKTEIVNIRSGMRYSTSMNISIPADFTGNYLNVYGEVWYGDKRQDRKLVTVKIVKPEPAEPEEPTEEEQPVESGNIVVTAVLTKPAVRAIKVMFYKGDKIAKSGILKKVGDRISLEVAPHAKISFVAAKRLSPLGVLVDGAAEEGEKVTINTFTYSIEIKNMIRSKS